MLCNSAATIVLISALCCKNVTHLSLPMKNKSESIYVLSSLFLQYPIFYYVLCNQSLKLVSGQYGIQYFWAYQTRYSTDTIEYRESSDCNKRISILNALNAFSWYGELHPSFSGQFQNVQNDIVISLTIPSLGRVN